MAVQEVSHCYSLHCGACCSLPFRNQPVQKSAPVEGVHNAQYTLNSVLSSMQSGVQHIGHCTVGARSSSQRWRGVLSTL